MIAKPGLATLIAPGTVEQFLLNFKSSKPFVIHHSTTSLAALRELPFLNSLDDLLRSWPDKIEAHLPDVRDEASSIETTNKDARKLFDNGMGLLFKEAQKLSPVLTEWLEQLRLDLGISNLTFSRCLVYATPNGKGTAPHFDQNINFVLQISGTKKWYIAANSSVENPLTRHTMNQEIDPELASYTYEQMPVRLPEDAHSFVLKPGSLLFVPRGCWHSTEAEGDALSLNFTFSAPAWIDLFLAALRSRLIQSPDWRETASGMTKPQDREEAEMRMNELLAELIQDLPNWRGEDILSVTDSL